MRYGGFETFAEQLATRLTTRGVDVTVFCPAPAPRSDETYRGVTLKFIKRPVLGKYSELFWDALCFCVARHDFDVVYMLGLGGTFMAWVPMTFWCYGYGLIQMESSGKRTKFTWPQRFYLSVAEALGVVFSNRIVADSAAIAAYLHHRYPGLKRASMIAYARTLSPTKKPDQELIEEWALRLDEYYLIVCRLEPENHVLEILEGFEQSDSSPSCNCRECCESQRLRANPACTSQRSSSFYRNST